MYIVFEGIVGTGKTTHSKKFATYLKKKNKDRKIKYVREPGGSEVADAIRKLVQGTLFDEKIFPVCEAYLYAASRAQILRKDVGPVISEGGMVVSDRSFITSMAYQGYARKYGIQRVYDVNKHAIEGYEPDLIIHLTLKDIKKAVSRTFDKDGDRWEQMPVKFFEDVSKGYNKIARLKHMKNKWLTIDLSETDDIEINFKKILAAVNKKEPTLNLI